MSGEEFLDLASQEWTYSTAFIAMPVACLSILFFEVLQNAKGEIDHIWPSPWRSVKWLFYINRVAPFCLLISALEYALQTNPTAHSCKRLIAALCTFVALCHMASELLLYLRVWAISGKSRKLAIFLIGNVVVVFGVAIICIILYIRAGAWGPKVTIADGCISLTRGSRDSLITLVFALLLYSGLVVAGLSVYYGIQFHRQTKPGPLLVMFYRDGTVYFIVVVAMSITNAIIAVLIPRFSRFVVIIPYSLIMTVICCRMVLHLRQIAAQNGSGDRLPVRLPSTLPHSRSRE